MFYTLTAKSKNVKTGPIPVSMSDSKTCPSACPFKKSGCYAKSGPLAFNWAALDRGFMKRKGAQFAFGMNWKAFLGKIASLPSGTFWRHNQAGDLPGLGNAIAPNMLAQLVEANKGRNGFTYTHKPMTEANQTAVKHANANGFTVNLSGNSLFHADKLMTTKAGPVVAVIPADFKDDKGLTPAGNRFVVCPAQTSANRTCATCKLCSKQRSIIIAFKAHGMNARKVSEISKA